MIRVSTYADVTERRRVEVVLELVLPYDLRKKSRLRTWSQCGKEVGLFLERGNVLKAGDELRAESGELVRIRAAEEAVSTARCDDPLLLLKAAYHLGNRHVPLQIGYVQQGKSECCWLRYQPDYVLDDMLLRMGLTVTQDQAPFHPESGAYGSAANITATEFKRVQAHSHFGHSDNGHSDNGHGHEHDHLHGHSHSHSHGSGHHHG